MLCYVTINFNLSVSLHIIFNIDTSVYAKAKTAFTYVGKFQMFFFFNSVSHFLKTKGICVNILLYL